MPLCRSPNRHVDCYLTPPPGRPSRRGEFETSARGIDIGYTIHPVRYFFLSRVNGHANLLKMFGKVPSKKPVTPRLQTDGRKCTKTHIQASVQNIFLGSLVLMLTIGGDRDTRKLSTAIGIPGHIYIMLFH